MLHTVHNCGMRVERGMGWRYTSEHCTVPATFQTGASKPVLLVVPIRVGH